MGPADNELTEYNIRMATAVKSVETTTSLDRDRAAEARFQWPELWAKLDELFAVVNDSGSATPPDT